MQCEDVVLHSAPQDLHEVKRTQLSSMLQLTFLKRLRCSNAMDLPQGGQQIPVTCAGRAIRHAGVASRFCGAPHLGNCWPVLQRGDWRVLIQGLGRSGCRVYV